VSRPVAIPTRLSVAGVIAWREAKAAMRGVGGLAALTVALIAAIWVVLVDVRALEAGGVLVLADPLKASMSTAILVLALFVAVSAAVSAARDRESGTLEVLFYGPVDEVSYILGKLGGLLFAYVAGLPLLIVSFAILSALTGFALTVPVVLGLCLSVIPAAEIIGFGVMLSVGTDRVRTALLVLITTIAVLLGISIAYAMVLLVEIDDPSSSVLPLRDTLAALDAVVRWISPFAYLERVVDGAASRAWRTALAGLAASVAFTAAMTAIAAWWLRRRGVHSRGE
jgi:ABC-type transport system involved in multi-copper enzyme maturation permease subunit